MGIHRHRRPGIEIEVAMTALRCGIAPRIAEFLPIWAIDGGAMKLSLRGKPLSPPTTICSRFGKRDIDRPTGDFVERQEIEHGSIEPSALAVRPAARMVPVFELLPAPILRKP